jgi:hypothetical protein
VPPELFDETTDRAHQSYHSAICGAQLGSVRFRGPGHYMPLHPSWCLRRTTSIYPGEMAETLEDVAFLFGLPCSGEPMGLLTPQRMAR